MRALTEVESITGRWRDDHDYRQKPLDSVRPKRRSKGSGAGPESGEWENTLSSALSDQSRLAQQHGNEIAEG